MAKRIDKLQIRKTKFDSTRMTDLNHWSKLLALKPTVFEAPDRLLFASRSNSINLSTGNVLEGIFGLGKTKYIDDLNWKWKLNVKSQRPITVLENKTTETTSTPGKYRRPIILIVDADLAVLGETWSPGSSDKSQVCILTNKVALTGNRFEYTFKTYTESSEHYIKPKYLEPGVMWNRMYAMRGEAAESGGSTEIFTNIMYHNSLVKLRKQYKVTDYGAQAVLEIAFADETGKIYHSWMDMQQASYTMAMNKELAMNAVYSRLGDIPLIDPDSGYPIVPGAGLDQQIEFGGIVEDYPDELSAERIEAFFDRIVYSRISPGDLGDVVGFSGHYGMKNFDKAFRKLTNDRGVILNSQDMISKVSGVNNNSLQTGYQFVKYNLPNGGSFRLVHNPLNDDKAIHRDIDPLTGIPLESQKITIVDITGGNGQSINVKDNIRLVRKNKVHGVTIVKGRVGPGGVINTDASHGGDYYQVDISDTAGIEITDPTVTGMLRKTVND